MSEKRTGVAKDVLSKNAGKIDIEAGQYLNNKLNNLLTFTEHSEKYKQAAKKTKRTDVAKDVLEKKENQENEE